MTIIKWKFRSFDGPIETLEYLLVDCEQSLFFFTSSKGSSLARDSPVTRVLFSCLARFAGRTEKKRETARSLIGSQSAIILEKFVIAIVTSYLIFFQ